MRILIIIDGLSGGGAEKSVLTISKGLLKIGHQVSLFSLRTVCDYPIPEGIDFQIINEKRKKIWHKFTEISRRAQKLDCIISSAESLNGKFDIIFSHLHKTDRIVASSRVLERNKIWFCIHGILSFSYLHHRFGLSRWIKYFKIRYTYKNRNVIAVSLAILHDIKYTMAIPLRRGVVIYNPFDVDTIQRQSQEPFEMQGLNYIISVGRLHEHKRHDRLLKAYALSKIDAPLVIIGKGTKRKLKQLKILTTNLNITDKVIFHKFVTNPYPWIRGARVLVLSSDCEGLSNVIIEAIICRTPVVSTRCLGGPAEILTGPLSVGLTEMNELALSKTLSKIYSYPPIINNSFTNVYEMSEICQQYITLSKSN